MGGDVASGFLRGTVGPDVGVAALAAARSQPFDVALMSAGLALDGTGCRLVLPGLSGSVQGARLDGLWSTLAELASTRRDIHVIADLGRLVPGAAHPLLARADAVVLVTPSSLRAVAAARPVVRRLTDTNDGHVATRRVAAVVVGERRPYPADEVTDSLGVELAGTITWDAGAAAVLSDGEPMSRRFARSALIRSVSVVARSLHGMTAEAVAGPTAVAEASVTSSAPGAPPPVPTVGVAS
ncbi:MAG: hypothetical protein GC157_04775 [Frankiales bacterium]|nr:hypothetical protein [Frankiales bacterium]